MLLAFAFVAFGALGWQRAAKRGGTRVDCIHYALVHAIAGTLATLLLQAIAWRVGLIA